MGSNDSEDEWDDLLLILILIFVFFQCGCFKPDRANIVFLGPEGKSLHLNCEYVSTTSGYYLRRCDNGKEYHNVTNVEFR